MQAPSRFLGVGLILFVCGCVTRAATAPATTQASSSDQPWSIRMADTVMRLNPDPTGIEHGAPRWSYSVAFAVYGVGRAGEESGDARYIDYAKRYMSAFMDDAGNITTKTYDPKTYKLDDVSPGRVILLLYRQTHDPKYLHAAQTLVQQLRTQPRTTDGGFWHKQIYTSQMWLDGIYMACPVMADYAKTTGERQWFDEAARQILTIAKHTRDNKTGLLVHGWDESKAQKWADPQTGKSACFWGRAMGWYAMGLVETLADMPADHPQRAQLIQTLRGLAEAIAAVQDPKSGCWYQVLDQGSRAGNYLESSATGMFVFSLAKGARLGYLDDKYSEVARRGFDGMIKQFVKTDPATGNVTLTDTCQVAGLGGNDRRNGTFEYYISEPRVNNDSKGVAPFILASLELQGPHKPAATTQSGTP